LKQIAGPKFALRDNEILSANSYHIRRLYDGSHSVSESRSLVATFRQDDAPARAQVVAKRANDIVLRVQK
jgi:hypothetical protein